MNKRRNILSAFAAGFGVVALILLESAITTIKDPATRWAMRNAFAAIGMLRWYLFYEGQSLREVNDMAARIAFRWSVFISGLVIVYGCALYVTGSITWHVCSTFVLLTFTLSVVEWVYGQRAGATVLPIVTRLTTNVSRTKARALSLVRIAKDQRNTIDTLRADIRSNTSELQSLTLRLENAERQAVKVSRLAGRKVQVPGKTRTAVICACGDVVEYSIAAKNVSCNCGKLITNN